MKPVAIAYTLYPVTEPWRARRFYEETLGLTASRVVGTDLAGMVEYDLGPHTLAIGWGGPLQPSAGGGAAAIEVQDWNAALARLRQHQVSFVLEPQDSPHRRSCAISDPDGNTLIVHQRRDDLEGPAVVHQ